MTAGGNRLPILQAEIKTVHDAALLATRTSLKKAIEAGELLIETKSLVPDGGWLAWLKQTGSAPRTAQNYMRLAILPPDQYANLAHLGIRRALDAAASALLDHPLDYAEAVLSEIGWLLARIEEIDKAYMPKASITRRLIGRSVPINSLKRSNCYFL
jgi:hypothetical protein